MIFFQVFVLFFIVAVTCGIQQIEEGDPCYRETSGEEGTCKRLSDCPVALAAEKYNINPQLCGLIGIHTIVCCLHSTDPSAPTSSPSRSSSSSSIRNKNSLATCPDQVPKSGTIGVSCDKKDGQQGKCLHLKDCPSALAGIKKGNRPEPCFMMGTVPMVCCDL